MVRVFSPFARKSQAFRSSLHRFIFTLLGLVLCSHVVGNATRINAAEINVPAGGDLQAAIYAAQPGDMIVLEAGASYTGAFVLPYKGTGDAWITFRSSAEADLPREGQRVSPSDADRMPKIVSRGLGEPALSTQDRAHHYRFVGIEFKIINERALVYDLVRLGSGEEVSLEQIPHHLSFDRCYIHGEQSGTLKRGVALNSAHTEIVNSYISECKSPGQDTQAIAGWSGPGPFRIENNHLEAAGYPVIFGGALNYIEDLVPSDIVVKRNTLTRPLAWRGVYAVKNLFELKNARRVLIDGNLFENNWVSAQNGYAILFTVRDEYGAMPWAVIEDIDFTNNIVRHSGGVFNIGTGEGRGTRRINISNNVLEDISSVTWGGKGTFVQINDAQDVTVDHNTVFQDAQIMLMHTLPSANLKLTNNLMAHNEYGIFGDGVGVGNAAINAYLPNATVRRNVIAGGLDYKYPADNFFPASYDDDEMFVDREGGDYRLKSASAYKNAGTDGRDLGCDVDKLIAAQTTATPTTTTPAPVSTTAQLAADAYASAAQLAAATVSTPAVIEALTMSIEAAQNALASERGNFQAEDEIERGLTFANYFSHAALALARAGANSSSVQSRLQVAAEHLAHVKEMTSPVSSVATFATQSVAPGISFVEARSSATLVSVVAPDSAAMIIPDRNAAPIITSRSQASGRAAMYEIARASVTVGGVAARLMDASPAQINFVVPKNLPAGEAEVVVTTQSGIIARGRVTIAALAPGIFANRAGGNRVALGRVGIARRGFWRAPAPTANEGDTSSVIYATGFSNAVPNTDLSNDFRTRSGSLINLAENMRVEARAGDGRSWWLTVQFAGASGIAGIDQVRVALPAGIYQAGTLELTLVIGDTRSNTALLNFRQPVIYDSNGR